jgi:hypothetical protein
MELLSSEGSLFVILDDPDNLPLWLNKISSCSLHVKGIYSAVLTNPHPNTVTKRSPQASWYPIVRVVKEAKGIHYYNSDSHLRDSFFIRNTWKPILQKDGHTPIDSKQRSVDIYTFLLAGFAKRGNSTSVITN